MTNNIEIWDCTPQMADVVSGAISRPRERRSRENAFRWLVDATTVWPRVIKHFGLAEQWPGVKYRPNLKPPTGLGLDEFCHAYSLAWHKPPESRSILLLVNSDGTRCAILDLVEEVARLWANVQRPRAGRPRIETDNPKSLASRRYRARQASYCGDCELTGRGQVKAWKDNLCRECWHAQADAKSAAI